MNRFSCIVLAGGNGSRFGSKKQFIEWNGKPLWKHVADICRQASNDVVVVGVDVPAGKVRQESVFNGLKKITNERVVIAEAARPGVTVEQIKKIGCTRFHSSSYGMPSIDTILYDSQHLDREKTLQLQVPQAFDTDLLLEAHTQGKGSDVTSDTELMYNIHDIKPAILLGGINLMKITYPSDIKLLRYLNE